MLNTKLAVKLNLSAASRGTELLIPIHLVTCTDSPAAGVPPAVFDSSKATG